MKKLYFLFFSLILTLFSFGQTTVFQESFETGNSGTASINCNDGFGDFFTRTDGTDISSSYQVSGGDGSFFFAAQDVDATECGAGNDVQFLLFDDIDISTFSNLTLAVLIAEDAPSDGNFDWDGGDLFYIEVDYDNSGTFTKILQFATTATSGFNVSTPSQDTNLDGLGDGLELTPTFTEFTSSLGTGSLIDVRLVVDGLGAGDEDVAFDNIRIIEDYIAIPTLTLTDAPASGGVLTTTPEAANDATIDFTTSNFTVAVPPGGDGYIKWEVKDAGNNIVDSGDIFTTDGTETAVNGLVAGNTYSLFAQLVDPSGVPIVPAVEYTLTVIIPSYTVVTDIADLRADVTTNGDGGYYEITGNVLVTHTDGFNNRHWVQDNNIAGILITEDGSESGISPYSVGDNVSGLKGGTEIVNGVLRFLPTADSGVVTSFGNPVVPQVVTIPQLNSNIDDYESELIELSSVTFVDGNGSATFSTGTNYNVTDGANTIVKRTDFFGADYIGAIIPSSELLSLVAITGEFNGTAQIYVRSMSDITLSNDEFNQTSFSLYPNPTNTGLVNISTSTNEVMNVQVFDVLGKKVKQLIVANNSINVSELNAGVYFVKITQNNASATKKLIIN
ncbi:MAG: T9SS type A sorting domain-containing protein [Winogradskyella sp.]|nr:T9SS type A sorting domain-containing protein [Winogradskyella sp.]